MKKVPLFKTLMVLAAFLALSCSDRTGNPIATAPSTARQDGMDMNEGQHASPGLWGYYDINLDIDSKTAQVTPNRSVMGTMNIVSFLNANPAALQFGFNDINSGDGYVDVDLNVTITHPFSTAGTEFNAYDVRGILIGNGSSNLVSDSKVSYPKLGTDQYLKNADGLTRWFNPTEFAVPGVYGYMD